MDQESNMKFLIQSMFPTKNFISEMLKFRTLKFHIRNCKYETRNFEILNFDISHEKL